MSKISTKIFLLILMIFLITLINGLLITYYLINSSNDTEVINQLGIIRGLIQRVTLLTLIDHKNEMIDNIKTIDLILKQLTFYDKKYYFLISTKKLEKNILDLQEKWSNLKNDLNNYQTDKNEFIKNRIIKKSEELWFFADQTVLIAEHRAENLKKRLQITFYAILINLILILFILWISKILIKDKLEYFANYDSLTNTLNRKTFYIYLNNFIKISKRYNKPFCLFIFDIDFFKEINDSQGHQIGDEILKSIINLIKNEIRETDILARFGGDEFLILTPEINIKKGLVIAEKVRKTIENITFINDIKTTISFGLTEYKNEDTINSIMNRADNALYQAKNKGRNNCFIL